MVLSRFRLCRPVLPVHPFSAVPCAQASGQPHPGFVTRLMETGGTPGAGWRKRTYINLLIFPVKIDTPSGSTSGTTFFQKKALFREKELAITNEN